MFHKPAFSWEDPFLLEDQLSEDEAEALLIKKLEAIERGLK